MLFTFNCLLLNYSDSIMILPMSDSNTMGLIFFGMIYMTTHKLLYYSIKIADCELLVIWLVALIERVNPPIRYTDKDLGDSIGE